MSNVIKSDKKIILGIHSKSVILCDMDGTLVDTDYANYLSYRRAIKEVTRRKNDLQFNPGTRLNRVELKKRLRYLTDDQYNEIVALKTDYYGEYLSETKVNAALEDFLWENSGENEVVLVTCCRRKRAVETLAHHKALGRFSRLICAEDLPENGASNKYLNVLSLFGAIPVSCIVCENDIADIEGALLAGVPRENIIHVCCQN